MKKSFKEGQAREKEDSPSFCELLEEIEVHTTNTDVIGVDILSPLRTIQPLVAPVKSEVAEATPDPTPPITEQSPNPAPPVTKQSPDA